MDWVDQEKLPILWEMQREDNCSQEIVRLGNTKLFVSAVMVVAVVASAAVLVLSYNGEDYAASEDSSQIRICSIAFSIGF